MCKLSKDNEIKIGDDQGVCECVWLPYILNSK